MKKFLTFALVCCLVFSSSSTVFATATQWDTNDQKNLNYIATSVTSGGSLYNLVNNIYSRMNTINNNLTDIKGYLVHGKDSIATILYNIQTWMSPIYNAIVESPTELRIIEGLLGYPSTDSGSGVTTWNSYLKTIVDGSVSSDADYFNLNFDSNGNIQFGSSYHGSNLLNAINSNLYWLQWLNMNKYNLDLFTANALTSNYSASQNFVNWTDLSNSSFNPVSTTDGIYKWLSNIQAPVARLSYVLASDERIEAQEKAEDNEQAVVDNFIDSSGSGAASTSDFGSVSNLSSGFKNNISTDANVSGIWNIFNSNNFGWFSQETADQLDTTSSGNRMLRSSGSYPTPLLDKQTEDIMNILGGDDND